jgi:hypothetical protein
MIVIGYRSESGGRDELLLVRDSVYAPHPHGRASEATLQGDPFGLASEAALQGWQELVPTGLRGGAGDPAFARPTARQAHPYRDTEGVDRNNGISPSTSVG